MENVPHRGRLEPRWCVHPTFVSLFTLVTINSFSNPSNHLVNLSVTSLTLFMKTNSISKWVIIHMTFHEQDQFMKSSVSFRWRGAVVVSSVDPPTSSPVSDHPPYPRENKGEAEDPTPCLSIELKPLASLQLNSLHRASCIIFVTSDDRKGVFRMTNVTRYFHIFFMFGENEVF